MSEERKCGNCCNFSLCAVVKESDTPEAMMCEDFDKLMRTARVCVNCSYATSCMKIIPGDDIRRKTCAEFSFPVFEDARPSKNGTTDVEREVSDVIVSCCKRDPRALEPYFSAYMNMMTDCSLFSKGDIAKVLASLHMASKPTEDDCNA